MSSTELPAIAELHANAIAQFQQGEYCQARMTLVEVIYKLKSVCPSEFAFMTDVAIHSETSNDEIVRLDEAVKSNQQAKAVSDHCNVKSDSFYVRPEHNDFQHNHVFTGAFSLMSDIQIVVSETSAVVMFNLALTIHIIGTKTGKSADLRRSLHLYKQCLSLLEHSYRDSAALTLMVAALYLNMAHIFGTFNSVKQAKSMISKLAELFVWMRHERSAAEIIRKEDFLFFASASFFAGINHFKSATAA
jgi:hypothetical protein